VPYGWVEVLGLLSVQKLSDARVRKRFTLLCRCWLVPWFCFSKGKNCIEYIINSYRQEPRETVFFVNAELSIFPEAKPMETLAAKSPRDILLFESHDQ
jgi:hypothetical protein